MQHITRKKVVISGMGPGGLATAWEAARCGMEVEIISDRGSNEDPKFLRPQRVFLSTDQRSYLLNMVPNGSSTDLQQLNPDDVKFLYEISNGGVISIKDVERYLYRRLESFSNIKYHFQSQLRSIDMEQGSCSIDLPEGKSETRRFDYMVGGDGVKHHAATVLNQEYKHHPPIIYESTNAQPLHPFHGAFHLALEREEGKPFTFDLEKATPIVGGEDKIGAIAFDTTSYHKSNKEKIKLHFVCELPQAVYNNILETKEEKEAKAYIIKFVTPTIENFLRSKNLSEPIKISFTKSAKHESEKNPLKHQIFETHLEQANTAVWESKNGFRFLLIGDAYRKPNYQVGHGLEDTFKEAQFLGRVFRGEKTLAEYNQKCFELSREADTSTRLFNDRRIKAYYDGASLINMGLSYPNKILIDLLHRLDTRIKVLEKQKTPEPEELAFLNTLSENIRVCKSQSLPGCVALTVANIKSKIKLNHETQELINDFKQLDQAALSFYNPISYALREAIMIYDAQAQADAKTSFLKRSSRSYRETGKLRNTRAWNFFAAIPKPSSLVRDRALLLLLASALLHSGPKTKEILTAQLGMHRITPQQINDELAKLIFDDPVRLRKDFLKTLESKAQPEWWSFIQKMQFKVQVKVWDPTEEEKQDVPVFPPRPRGRAQSA